MAWPDGGTNEVTETIGATGRNYSTIAAWEAATDEDCTAGWGEGIYAAPCSPVGDCYDDGDFADNVTMAGTTTNSTYFRRLTVHAGQRHAGVDGAGVTTTGTLTIGNYDDYAVVEWLIIKSSTTHQVYLFYSHNGTSLMLRNCIVCGTGEVGIFSGDGGLARTLYVRNCVVYGMTGSYPRPMLFDATDTIYVQNCSVLGSTYSGVITYGICTNVICMADSGKDCFYQCTGDYNIGRDETAPGENSIDNVAPTDIYTNVGSGTKDLHLKSDATPAAGAGADLSAQFTIDIDGDTRVAWDIGADEYVAGGPTFNPSWYVQRRRGREAA